MRLISDILIRITDRWPLSEKGNGKRVIRFVTVALRASISVAACVCDLRVGEDGGIRLDGFFSLGAIFEPKTGHDSVRRHLLMQCMLEV